MTMTPSPRRQSCATWHVALSRHSSPISVQLSGLVDRCIVTHSRIPLASLEPDAQLRDVPLHTPVAAGLRGGPPPRARELGAGRGVLGDAGLPRQHGAVAARNVVGPADLTAEQHATAQTRRAGDAALG